MDITSMVLTVAMEEARYTEIVPDENYFHWVGVSSVNDWLVSHGAMPLVEVTQRADPPAKMQCWVFLGAVAALDVAGFIAGVNAAPWRRPDRVQLFMMEQSEGRFRTVVLSPAPADSD
jgi:hypothetical protein